MSEAAGRHRTDGPGLRPCRCGRGVGAPPVRARSAAPFRRRVWPLAVRLPSAAPLSRTAPGLPPASLPSHA